MSLAQSPPPIGVRSGVTFDEYLRLRADPDYAGLRMAYLDGVLEIMAPDFAHEVGSKHIEKVVEAYCRTFRVPWVAAGETTVRRGTRGTPRGAGNEPDESYYFGATARAIAARRYRLLRRDGPPALWVEVDHARSSVPREPLYHRLRVPEVWRYRVADGSITFRQRTRRGYVDAAASAALPGLSPALVREALHRGLGLDNLEFTDWLLQEWFPAHREALEAAGAGR